MLDQLIASIPPEWRLATLAEHEPKNFGVNGHLWFASLSPRCGGRQIIASGEDASDALSGALAGLGAIVGAPADPEAFA